jgi:arylsulfatase A
VTCMDAAIGELLDLLRELGLEQNTLVIFFSDNGGSGNGGNKPLRGGKGTLFEGGLRVPFIARWPRHIPANTETDEFLSSLEVFPTLLAAAGGSRPPGVVLDGFDMLPVLQGKAKSARSEMFWQMREAKAPVRLERRPGGEYGSLRGKAEAPGAA